MFQRASFGFLAGLLSGLVVVTGLVVTDTRIGEKDVNVIDQVPTVAAANDFLSDWQRMRQGTWSVDSKFVRLFTDGRNLSGDIHDAQRPPLRVRTSFGTTTIDEPGKTTVCAAKTDAAQASCRSTDATRTFQQVVDADLATIRSLVIGDAAAYGVMRTDRQCYRLLSNAKQATSSWGTEAIFCFDLITGAIQRSEIRRDQATDTVTATSIRGHVADSEFQPPAV